MDTNTSPFRRVHLLEQSEIEKPQNNERVAYPTRDLLVAVCENPEGEGLQRTPERVARMYEELLAGYRTDPVALVNGAIFESDYKNIVLVRDIEFYSLCEHHMLPFTGKAHVAYIPDGKIIGLSKIPRLVEMYARRLQGQERMTQQIAEALQELLPPRGVRAVVEEPQVSPMYLEVKQAEANMV